MPRKKGKGRGQGQAAAEQPEPGARQQQQQPPIGAAAQPQQQQQPARGPAAPAQQQPQGGPAPAQQWQQPPKIPGQQQQQPSRGPAQPPQQQQQQAARGPAQQQTARGPAQQQQQQAATGPAQQHTARGPAQQQQQQQQAATGPAQQQTARGPAQQQQQQQPSRGPAAVAAPPQQQQQQPAAGPAQQQQAGRPAQQQRGPAKQPQEHGGARPRAGAPPQVISGGVSGVTQQISRLTVEGSQDFPCQQIGTIGRKIVLLANHFKVDLPEGFVYHYDVDIRAVRRDKTGTRKASDVPRVGIKPEGLPTKLPAKLCRQIMEQMFVKYKIKNTHWPAYDGNKNLYTRKRLPIQQVTQFDVVLLKVPGDAGSEELFQVTIKPAEKENGDCEVSLEPLHQMAAGRAITYPEETVLALDIILRYGPSLKSVPVGRSFFMRPQSANEVVMEEGRAIWFGYFQSLRPGWKPLPKGCSTTFYLNIDKAATAFLRPLNLVDFTREILGLRGALPPVLNPNQVITLSKKLRGIQIKVLHLPYPRKYKIVKIVKEKANEKKFNFNNEQITIARYFEVQYRMRLQYPNFPCVQVGDPKREIFLPMEVCQILEEQPSPGKLTPGQAAEMVKHTAIPPHKRMDEITRFVGQTVQDNKEILKEFDIKISQDPVQFQGRVLPAPSLEYKDSRVPVRDGQWEMRGKTFVKACVINKWVILSLCRSQKRDMVNFADKLCGSGVNAGMHFDRPCAEAGEYPRAQPGNVGQILGDYKKRFPDLQLAVVVLEKMSVLYKEVKHEGETNIGLITQCVTEENVHKCQNERFSFRFLMNICQKINAKLGGTNVSLQVSDKPKIFSQPIIVIGADVTHPAPGVNDGYSIAACVGSVDSYPAKYVTKILIQRVRNEVRAREERILELDVMIKDLLKAFYSRTRKKPERIVFFRDGVSEGQFLQVRNYELKKIRDACTSLEAGYEPKISFIVVQKRHHTRFAPQNFKDGLERYNYNVPAGTTVDTDITHPSYFNFFLASHVALQGTTRPAHYTVLWDDNDFNADTLQKFVFYLCHTYNRCTRSISIPPPVAYADLAAFRAKLYIDNKNEKMTASTDSSDSLPEDLLKEYMAAIVTKDNIKNEMYFV